MHDDKLMIHFWQLDMSSQNVVSLIVRFYMYPLNTGVSSGIFVDSGQYIPPANKYNKIDCTIKIRYILF